MSDLGNGSFLIFGGFVNGSRTNELALFEMANSQTVEKKMIFENSTDGSCPKPRASSSSAVYQDKLYVFGGQDDDNGKLDDLWCFDIATQQWQRIQIEDGALRPPGRSGHRAVVYGNKMYIFGGILELTKELNDMLVYDFTKNCFVQGDELPDYID